MLNIKIIVYKIDDLYMNIIVKYCKITLKALLYVYTGGV